MPLHREPLPPFPHRALGAAQVTGTLRVLVPGSRSDDLLQLPLPLGGHPRRHRPRPRHLPRVMLTTNAPATGTEPRISGRRVLVRWAGDTGRHAGAAQARQRTHEGTIDHHASLTHLDPQEITIRWRGSFGYTADGATTMTRRSPLPHRVPRQRRQGLCPLRPRRRRLPGYHPELRPVHRAGLRCTRHRRHRRPRRLQEVAGGSARNPSVISERLH